jgi:hypothetical protein
VKRLVLLLLLAACQKSAAPSASAPRAQPKPLEPLERVVGEATDGGAADDDPLYRIVVLTPVGPALPSDAVTVLLDGERATADGQPFEVAQAKGRPVLLVPGADTYLVQAAPLLAALDDAKAEVWLQHPDAPIAFKLALRDEAMFQTWLDEVVPGKLRVIHRADGFEMQTNMGKLPGGDPNGPTVPVRGGKLDLKTLQRGFEKVQARFTSAPDYCVVPSFGMELAQTARAMAANYVKPKVAFFPETCLVYPRPRQGDAVGERKQPADAGH